MAGPPRQLIEAVAGEIADGWLAGGFASKKKCILTPEDAQGQVMRAAGPMFERMLAGGSLGRTVVRID